MPCRIEEYPEGRTGLMLVLGSAELEYRRLSSVEVVDYPDSGKVGVTAGVKNSDIATATYRGMGRMTAADYYDGENT